MIIVSVLFLCDIYFVFINSSFWTSLMYITTGIALLALGMRLFYHNGCDVNLVYMGKSSSNIE